MSELVRGRGLVSELICRLDDDKSRAGDQVVGLEKPVNRRLRDEVTLGIREPNGQFPGAQFSLIQGKINDLITDIVRDTVPYSARIAVTILKTDFAKGQVAVVPTIKCCLRNAELLQGWPDAEMGLFDQMNDLKSL